MNIYESAEDYLERILILQEKGEVRSIDIAHDMGFSKPSISVAMKKLKEAGLIDIDEHGYISLTKEGHIIADKVYERHIVLKKILTFKSGRSWRMLRNLLQQGPGVPFRPGLTLLRALP